MKILCAILVLWLIMSGTVHADDPACARAGCSAQLCISTALAPRIQTTCEWRKEYQCFKDIGVCEIQPGGSCGWRKSPELVACLEASHAKEQQLPREGE